jgi:two-component system, cell cycle sensor histidine kinase and response regulator CckA
MNWIPLVEVVRNAGVLLAFVLLFDVVITRFPLRNHPRRLIAAGLAAGLLAIGVMATPYQLQSGVVFDTRSVLLSLSGLFLGLVPTLVAMVVATAYRLEIGGAGALTGTMVIVASGTIGIAWRYWRRGRLEQIGLLEFYALGMVVNLTMIALLLSLPTPISGGAIAAVAIPVLVVFPLATAALGSFAVDRLKRDRLTEELEASEARYRSLFKNNHAVMLVTDPGDGRIVDANPAASRFYGRPVGELARLSISDIHVEGVTEPAVTGDGVPEAGGATSRVRHRLASGEVRDVEVMKGEVDVGGRLLNYSIIRDVTSESIAVESLRLRVAALEAAANSIMITDRAGTIEWVNCAFNRLHGYSDDDVVGRNLREVTNSGAHDEAFFREMWKTLLAGETWSGFVMNRKKDGSQIEEELAITPVRDGTGEIAHFIAVKQDLTDRRALEQRLVVAQKLESVGQLAGGVAHDFNNLLTVINGTLDLVLSDIGKNDSVRRDLQEIRYAGERASTLTRQLLAFSGRQVLKKEGIDLNDLVLDMNSMLQRLIGANIHVVTELAKRPASVVADRGQLEQVLVNLVVNARDAMPAGGTLKIATTVEEPEGFEQQSDGGLPGPRVRLMVSDTGAGIDPTIQTRIFDPFFTTKEAGKGTGLGLATVYGIVTQSGGQIHLNSAPGQGTTFQIDLPYVAAAPASANHTIRHSAAKGSETILLVEDEASIRRLAERILSRNGYTVLTAGSGAEALKRLAGYEGDVALLFTDLVLPGMSGTELLERASDLQPGVKVLFASGYPTETLREHGLAESHHFLEKPYSVQGLTEKIRETLDA